jgi:hypothetical protein
MSTITISTDSDCVITYQMSVSGIIILLSDNLRKVL